MTASGRHAFAHLIGVAFLLAGLLGWPPTALQAQSTTTPPADSAPAPTNDSKTDGAPQTNAPGTGEEDTKQDRQRAYRRQKDELKEFAPSEEIRVDKAVDFPVDI